MDMLEGLWFGHLPGGYAGGADYFLNVPAGFPNFTLNRDHLDSFIRTFVDVPQPAPEPASSVGLLGLGLAGLGFVRGYRWLQRKQRVGRLEESRKGSVLTFYTCWLSRQHGSIRLGVSRQLRIEYEGAVNHLLSCGGRLEATAVAVFAGFGLVGVRVPFALIIGCVLHGLWDAVHEFNAHAGGSLLGPRQTTSVPLAYGFFCATYDFLLAAYFYTRRDQWRAAWRCSCIR
jgi:hypothetical protein